MPEKATPSRRPKDMCSELRRLLECPICTRPVSAPVFQCKSFIQLFVLVHNAYRRIAFKTSTPQHVKRNERTKREMYSKSPRLPNLQRGRTRRFITDSTDTVFVSKCKRLWEAEQTLPKEGVSWSVMWHRPTCTKTCAATMEKLGSRRLKTRRTRQDFSASFKKISRLLLIFQSLKNPCKSHYLKGIDFARKSPLSHSPR